MCVNHVSFVYAWLSVWGDQLDPVILSDRALSCARAWLFMAVPDTERAFLAYTHVTKRTTLHVFTPWFCHLIDGLDDRKQVRFSVILSCICHIRAEWNMSMWATTINHITITGNQALSIHLCAEWQIKRPNARRNRQTGLFLIVTRLLCDTVGCWANPTTVHATTWSIKCNPLRSDTHDTGQLGLWGYMQPEVNQ